MEYILRNAFWVNEGKCEKGGLHLKDGKIAAVLDEREAGLMPGAADAKVCDLQGAYVFPGVIDDHVHFREPGLTHKGCIATESAAALRGGVTSFMDMPNTKPQTLTQELLRQKYDMAAQSSLVNYSFYMGCSEDNLAEVLLTDPETVCGIKLFLGSSTGNMLVRNPLYLQQLFKEAPTLIAVHCEDEEIISRNTVLFKERYGMSAPFSVHPQIRSEAACLKSSAMAAELAHKYGRHLHLLHISTAKELNLIDSQTVTGEVCANYLWFSQEDYETKMWRIKCNPAIKTAADREALRQAVKEGRVNVATDHAPHTLAEKEKPYFECPSGTPGVQHSLPLMLELAHQGVFTLPEVAEAMCHRPARIFGIKGRGFLRPGYAADLAVVNPDEVWTVEASNIAYACGWSPLQGQSLHGKVRATFVNGTPVYQDGEIIAPDHRGERLLFERASS
ncbi:MAG: dihydroorotase [Bacteroides sp.]|nr:dihydroorotase [Bacteroides sp.]MCM1085996.1 dihydroorotase [Bacteroides sp.]